MGSRPGGANTIPNTPARAKNKKVAERTRSGETTLPISKRGSYFDLDDGQLQELLESQERDVGRIQAAHWIDAFMNASGEPLDLEPYMSAAAHRDSILAEILSRQQPRRNTNAKKRG
jgi:hypothetical protein